MGEKKLHYKMYKDGKKFVFAAIATLSFFVFGGVSTVAVHADTTSGNLTATTVNSTSDTKSAVPSAATSTSSSATKADSTSASSSSAVKTETTNASSSSATKTDSTSASSSSAVRTETTSASSSSATKADSTSASSSSAVKTETTSASELSTQKDDVNSNTQQNMAIKTLSNLTDTDKNGIQTNWSSELSAQKDDVNSNTQQNMAIKTLSNLTDTDKNGIQTNWSRDKSADTDNSDSNSVSNEAGQYWPNTKGYSLKDYSKTATTDFTKNQNFNLGYNPTPILHNSSDLSLYIRGQRVDLRNLVDDDSLNGSAQHTGHNSKGHSRLISTSDLGENTYFWAKNVFKIYNGITHKYDRYDLKWTLESVNYGDANTQIALGIKGSQDIGGTQLLNIGSGWQLAHLGNFFNTHLQFFKEENESASNEDPALAIANADVTAAAVSIHMGFSDIDNDEAVQLTSGVIKKVYVDSATQLAYQDQNGYLSVTRKYNDPSDVSGKNESKVTFLMEMDVPVEGFDLSVATIGNQKDSSNNYIHGQGTKVAPSLLSTMKYTEPLVIVYNKLDGNGNPTTESLQSPKVFEGLIGDKYTVDSTGNKVDTSAPSTITDSDGNIWKLVSEKTQGNPNGSYVDGTNEIDYYYQISKESAKVTYIDDTTGTKLSSQDLSGDYGSTDPYRTGDTIADYEKQGYQLVSDNYPTHGVVYNQDGTVQSFEVHLTHGTTPVGPNNPQTPGEPINPDNPDGPKWPEGTDKSSVTQTVIRTVNYLDKQTGKVVAKQVTEQVTYNRTAIVDKVTGQIIGYSTTGGDTVDQTDGDKAWTAVDNKSDWDSVTSPDLSYKGYLAPDLATVAQQTVTPGDKDVTVNVYYDHDVVPVNPTNPQTPGTPINPDDPDSPKWPAGTDKNSLTTDVHQTIHYQYGDGSQAAPDKTDSTTFDHQVEIDKVTGEIVKDEGWTAENGKTSFDSKNSPVIPGYTASKPASDSVDGLTQDSKDNVQTIIYTANQEAANVTYIDDTTGKTLSAKDLTGDYGSTDPYRTGDTIADYEKQGYQLVSDNYPTHGVVYNQDGTVQSFEVHLTHGTTPVGPNNPQTPGEPINPDNPDGPKWPEGTDKSSVTQTVIRTVNYLDKQTGKVVAKQVTEQVTYNRTAIVDKVTGQIIGYSTTGGDTVDQTDGDKAWTAVDNKSDWDSVTSPDLSYKGYLAPDLAAVAQQTVTPGDKDVTVNVYYDHDVVPVNPTNPQTPGTPINPDDPDSPKWPAGTDKNSLTTDVHQTIHYQYGDGSQAAPDKTDSTTFDHQVEIDKVTGEIVKDEGWTAENGKTSFDSKNSPVIPGYTASKPASDSVDGLTQDSKDNVQTIIYTANQEAANVTYIDDTTGKTLSAKDLTGDYGSTDSYRTGDTIADYEKQGYQLVSDNYPTHGVVYNQDGTVQSFEVHLTHGTTPVGPNNPQTPGEPINPDNPDGPKWPEGTDKSSVTQTVIRTVNYLDKQTGKVVAKQVTEQVTYNRTAIVDKVTGQIIGYSTTGGDTVDQTDGDKAWTAVDNKSDWDSVTSPDLSYKGYLAPDLAAVAQQTVTPGDKDVTVNVYYDHDVVPVNPTNPQTPGTPINPDDPDSPKWPAGTDKNSLTTDVHQTIHYQYGDGSQAAPDKTDSTTFDHQVEIDKVTGEIVKDEGWTAENGKTSFDSKNSPVIPGYTASKPASDSVDGLTQDSKDNVQTIIYTANQEAANVTYIDDTTGKTLSAKDLTGDYGSTDSYRTGDTIADYEKQGYQLVSDNYPTHGVVYNQDGTVQSFEVHLTHGTTPVGPNNPQTPGEPINPDNPDGPKWPEGTDKSSVTQTVIRTVNYLDKQTGKVVAKQVTEQVTYNRTAIVDKVTGQIIGYSTTGGDTVDQTDGDKAWTAVDNKSDWDSVTSPDLSYKGYLAPDLAAVAQQTVTPGDKDVTVNVYYDHDVVPVNPTNPQTPGTPINPDDPDSPKWPAGTDKNSLTTDVHQTIHYQYGDGSQAAPDKTDSTTFDHQVEIDKVTGEIVKDEGWTAENGKTSFDSKNSPVIPGYTASKPASDSVDGLTQDSKDNVQTIIYTANQEAANVTYIDDTTGKTLSAKDLTGDYGSTDSYRTGDTIADYEKQGYQLVSDNYPTHGVVYNQDGTVQSFEVHLTHGTTPVGPNNPQTPGEPINPDNPDGPKWPEGTDKSSVTQTVIRTVNYLDKQTGKVVAKQVTEQVTYNRTAIVDKVTGQIIGYSTTGGDTVDQTDGDKAWTAVDNKSDWDSVTSPDLSYKGYLAPDLATVAQQTVTPGDKDVTVNVYYDHDVVPVNPTNPQTPGTPINPDDPDSPKWPAGTDKNSLTTDVHQTIHYQYGDGSQAAPDKTDSTTFDHQVEIDKVTGEIVKDEGWTAENGKTSFDSKNSPVIPGYTASKPASDSVDGLTQDSKDNVQTIIYTANQEAANVTYIDDTTGKTLSAKDLTGDYGSTDSYRTGDTIADYEKQGYQLVSDNYPTHGVVYNQDGTVQSFEVHLTHGTTPVGPNNPQTPGEPINPDNPDGPKWPEGTDKSSVTQTVIRTVNYLDKQTGKVVAKQVTEQVTYNRTAIVDKVTGQIIGYSTTGGDTVDQTDGDKAWTAVDNKSDWDSVTSPDLSYKGYLAPDLATVAQQTVTPGDKDVTVNVYYDHDVVPVNPTNPQTPGTPINPDDPDSPKWPAGTDKNSLTTDVHQTIHYQYGDGSQAAPDKTDSTTFDHQVEIDKVTGEIVKDEGWTAENGKTSFDSKNSPVIPGYTASKPASDSVDGLTHDSKDNVQTIVYAKTPVAGGNVTAKYVDENGNPIADDVIASGNVGDPYSTTQKDVPGYTFKEVQGNPTGSFTDQDQTVTYVYTKNPATDNNGGTGLNQPGKPGNGTNNGVINTSTNTGSKVNNGAVNSPELPQTGENNSQSQTMSFIGILLAFGSLLGFLGIKKRRND
ncbi:mucin-binding protein [Latilactobacillus sakei]|uniref:mucin-binding protein n=1 Tax=Latilactobacillus sakei TaxID=1599 RepID=UPI00232EBEE3|nr:MucBP domain-containing protein [Latilactobacillus sakei]MDB1553823.1 MucBP domain-containing protein [Latilactobacillus sakei]